MQPLRLPIRPPTPTCSDQSHWSMYPHPREARSLRFEHLIGPHLVSKGYILHIAFVTINLIFLKI
jgi:hypothetical protein